MGNCACSRKIQLNNALSTTSEDLRVSFESSDVLRRIVSKKSEKFKKNIPYDYFTESPNSMQKSAIRNELLIRSYKMDPIIEACPGKLTLCESQSFNTEKFIEPQISIFFSQTSESFEGADLRSFDGVNSRTTNRYEIGLSMLKAQIHHGADPKCLSTHGERSTLMFAVLAEDFNFIKQLVELGVDVNQTNSLGETALSLANELQRDDITGYLLEKGAVEMFGKDSK